MKAAEHKHLFQIVYGIECKLTEESVMYWLTRRQMAKATLYERLAEMMNRDAAAQMEMQKRIDGGNLG